MIFVNYGAGEYHWLKHAPWDGLHLADVVFPFFVFIMGASIAVGFKSLTQRSTFSLRATFRRIVGRSVKLFLLGVVTNSIGSGISSNLVVEGAFNFVPLFLLSFISVSNSRFFQYSHSWGAAKIRAVLLCRRFRSPPQSGGTKTLHQQCLLPKTVSLLSPLSRILTRPSHECALRVLYLLLEVRRKLPGGLCW